MIGIFSLFGRSADQQLLDQAIRAAGPHPRLVPDAVKIVLQRQVKEAAGPAEREALRARLCDLLAYCMLGPDEFSDLHGQTRTAAVELWLDHALMAGDSQDARVILLFMHAGLVNGGVTDRYGLALED